MKGQGPKELSPQGMTDELMELDYWKRSLKRNEYHDVEGGDAFGNRDSEMLIMERTRKTTTMNRRFK